MNKKGFLLFEVIVTVVVLTAGLVLVTRAFIAAGKSVRVSGMMYDAASILGKRMFEFDMADEARESQSDGVDEAGSARFAWSQTVTAITGTGLALVRSEVTGAAGATERSWSVETYKRLKKDET
jgi:hypothetical protein